MRKKIVFRTNAGETGTRWWVDLESGEKSYKSKVRGEKKAGQGRGRPFQDEAPLLKGQKKVGKHRKLNQTKKRRRFDEIGSANGTGCRGFGEKRQESKDRTQREYQG